MWRHLPANHITYRTIQLHDRFQRFDSEYMTGKSCLLYTFKYFLLNWSHRHMFLSNMFFFQLDACVSCENFLMRIKFHGLTYLSDCSFFVIAIFVPIQFFNLLLEFIAFHLTINSSTPGLQCNWLSCKFRVLQISG